MGSKAKHRHKRVKSLIIYLPMRQQVWIAMSLWNRTESISTANGIWYESGLGESPTTKFVNKGKFSGQDTSDNKLDTR